MTDDYKTADNYLHAFARELNGVHGKKRDYRSSPITVRGATFNYYFTKKEVREILKSNGLSELSFISSLYKFEEDLEVYISTAVEKTPILSYTDWIRQNNLKIIVRKGDIQRCGS